ncbi:hypothetical protein EJ04DRAFT_27730 [Polyplosphaeria fusca]|uniref:Uncharacterized protein n=1 Tax=Polyplosphaeria fusca TaxID=682080 RepID=A0A9P4R8G3_9PLEO|nr:hypothetical protein EJ04DRAFT_27730 [Polyplosphaeria fusca]
MHSGLYEARRPSDVAFDCFCAQGCFPHCLFERIPSSPRVLIGHITCFALTVHRYWLRSIHALALEAFACSAV